MRKIIILAIIFMLIFPALAQAGKKHCGPLWAVWTHSEDPRECAIKTVFWMTLITAGVCYIAIKLTDDENALRMAPGIERKWEPAIWTGMDDRGNEYPIVGIKINW